MLTTRLALCVLATSLLACGGSPPPAAPPPSEAPQASADAAASAAPVSDADAPFGSVPAGCDEKKDNLCLPPVKFVKRLCEKFFPEVALAMFTKGSPWTRGYLRMNVEAWNASGGVSSADKLVFDEEVLVLRHRGGDTGGMQVSGSGGGYDVLRWDGTCASLADEELTLKAPPTKAKFAKIPWKSLDDGLRNKLEADEKIGKAVGDRRKECKGATMGEVSLKCVKADETVSVVVVDYVRSGGTVPAPVNVP